MLTFVRREWNTGRSGAVGRVVRRAIALGVLFSACATATLPVEASAPAVNPEPALPLVVDGPAAALEPVRRCDAEEALFGPYTVAGHWGGGWRACRVGPSPSFTFENMVHDDELLRRCFDRAGVTWLDGRVRVAATGAVRRVTIDELEPAGVEVRPCLLLVTRYRLVRAGCELEPRLHFVRFE